MTIHDRLLSMPPTSISLLPGLLDCSKAVIDAAITELEHAGQVGRRVCDLTGRTMLVQRYRVLTVDGDVPKIASRAGERKARQHKPAAFPVEPDELKEDGLSFDALMRRNATPKLLKPRKTTEVTNA